MPTICADFALHFILHRPHALPTTGTCHARAVLGVSTAAVVCSAVAAFELATPFVFSRLPLRVCAALAGPRGGIAASIWAFGIWHLGNWAFGHLGIWHLGIWAFGIWAFGIWAFGIWAFGHLAFGYLGIWHYGMVDSWPQKDRIDMNENYILDQLHRTPLQFSGFFHWSNTGICTIGFGMAWHGMYGIALMLGTN